jgi:ferrous iron transport protein A
METNKENLIRLGDMGLGKGIAFRVINFAPLGDPIEIKIRGFYLSIRKTQAKCIRVKKRKIEDQ